MGVQLAVGSEPAGPDIFVNSGSGDRGSGTGKGAAIYVYIGRRSFSASQPRTIR